MSTQYLQNLHSALRKSGARLILAESCTGGLLSAQITSLPGASDFFLGSLVTYHPHLKTKLLNVPTELIEQEGVVSGACALAMAEGALLLTEEATWSLATTGALGPAISSDLGSVFVAWSWRESGGGIGRHLARLQIPEDLIQRREVSQKWVCRTVYKKFLELLS